MKIKKSLFFHAVFFFCVQIVSLQLALSDPINKEIIARVNGKAILKEEVEFFIRQDLTAMETQGKIATPEDNLKIRTFWTEQLINEELILQQAALKSITVSDQDVEKALAKYNPEDSIFSKERLKKMVTNTLIIEKVISAEVLEKIKLSEDEIKKYYEEKREEFVTPEGDVISFEEVKRFIEKSLQGAVIFKETEKWIKMLKGKANIEIF